MKKRTHTGQAFVCVFLFAVGHCIAGEGRPVPQAPDILQQAQLSDAELFEMFSIGTDWNVIYEQRGDTPPADSWTEFWAHRIYAVKKNHTDSEKYIEYIVRTRRDMGLPDLPKSAFEWSPPERKPTVLPDTIERWKLFLRITKERVGEEKAGHAPPHGADSWAEHWDDVIRMLEASQAHHVKYTTHIAETRARAGLPGLD